MYGCPPGFYCAIALPRDLVWKRPPSFHPYQPFPLFAFPAVRDRYETSNRRINALSVIDIEVRLIRFRIV